MLTYLTFFIFVLINIGCSTIQKNNFNWDKYRKENPQFYFEDRKVLTGKLEDRFVELDESEIAEVKSMFSNQKYFTISPRPLNNQYKNFSWFQNEIKSIPENIKKILSKKVYAWTLVKNLGASGTVLYLRNKYHKYEKGILLLDISLFKKTYKEFCSYKELTLFKHVSKNTIECDYKGINVSAVIALFYHESAHIFGALNPFFGWKLKPSYNTDYPFSRLSWLKYGYKKGEIISRYDDLIPFRDKRHYYTNDTNTKIDAKHILEILKGWERANFFTLYSMFSPFEDWAESFAHYLISKYHKGKYTVYYKTSQGQKLKFESNIRLCAKKMKLMELYFKNLDLFI